MTARDPDGPEPDPDEAAAEDPAALDAAFDAIVAGLELPEPSGREGGPAEDADEVRRATGPGSFEELRAWVDVHPDLLADPEPTDDTPDADQSPEDHYVPPPPPPLPKGDRVSRWAWAGAVGAPLCYVLLALFGQDLGGVIGLTLIGAFVAGFVTLVLRMRDGPRVDDGPDDGAVV